MSLWYSYAPKKHAQIIKITINWKLTRKPSWIVPHEYKKHPKIINNLLMNNTTRKNVAYKLKFNQKTHHLMIYFVSDTILR